jgi:hypothetical protein
MMKELDGTSGYLTLEEVQYIKNETSRAPDRDLTFATVFEMKVIDPFAKTDVYYVADTDEGAAEIVVHLSDAKKIMVTGQRTTASIYDIAIGFELEMDDIETSRSWNKPLNTEFVARATRAVNEKLNALAYLGDTKFGVTSLLDNSSVTAITGTTISVMTDPASSFIGYFNSLPVVYRNKYQYKAVFADQEWKQLQKRGNTYNDKSIAQIILEAIPNLEIVPPEVSLDAGTTYASGGTVASGVAYLIPKNQEAVRMPIAMSPTAYTDTNTADRIVYGKVRARAGPLEIVFPTAIGKITGLA